MVRDGSRMPKKNAVNQDNPLVKVTRSDWAGCALCGATHQGRVYASDCCIPCHFATDRKPRPQREAGCDFEEDAR